MKTTTSEYIINKTIKDFKITDTSWIGDAIDWIGDCIEAIGYHCGFENKVSELIKVKNHTAEIPCDLIALGGVYYNGSRMLLGSDLSGTLMLHSYSESGLNDTITDEDFILLQRLYVKKDLIDAIEEPTEEDLITREDLCNQINTITECKRLSKSEINHCVLPYYNINAQYIQTSFSDGWIQILYRGFMLDSKGFPMLLDTFKYREAVKWGIMRNTILQGYIHPTVNFDMANAEWEKYSHQARNEQKMPSLDMLERFHNRWHSVKRGVNFEDSFTGMEQPQGTIY